jgi:hypothetical protein
MKGNIVSLFDKSGFAVRPWARAGFTCYCYDTERYADRFEHENVTYVQKDIRACIKEIKDLSPLFLSAFPPCTDLAISGARWFKRKREADPLFQDKAMFWVYLARDIAEDNNSIYYIENPVGVISTLWRKPDYIFQPWQYTGLCKEDNYSKKTCLWASTSFVMPKEAINRTLPPPDKRFIHMLGSHSRSKLGVQTPKGFSLAVYESNKEKVIDKGKH